MCIEQNFGENYIHFTPKKLEQLQYEYNLATKHNLTSFYFEDKEILTTFGKYLISYLEDKFNKDKDGN